MVKREFWHDAIESAWKERSIVWLKTVYPTARLLLVTTDAGKPRVNRQSGSIEAGLGHLEAAISLAMQ